MPCWCSVWGAKRMSNSNSASRVRRLIATGIDFVLLPPLALLLMLVSGVMEDAEAWVSPQPVVRILGLLLVSYLLLHGVLLVRRGQTIGKRLVGLQIISAATGDKLPLWRALFRAFGLLWLIAILWWLGMPGSGLVVAALLVLNPLAIFFKPRRCLHDYIAGSRVKCFSETQIGTEEQGQN